MKFHLPVKLFAAILAAQVVTFVGSTTAYGADPIYEDQTTGAVVANGETTWTPTETVTKVSYKNNTISGYGNGVLEMETGSTKTKTLNIIGFETVDFVENTDTNTSGNNGGTILMDVDGETTLNITNNTSVNISKNTASTDVATTKTGNVGGAGIYMTGKCYLNITGNTDVTFFGNETYATNHQSRGGAIYAGDSSGSPSVNISDNTGTVSFEGNKAESGTRQHAQGGAVYITSTASLTLNNNAVLSFCDNQVRNTGGIAQGAAIHNTSSEAFEISGNIEVNFSGNTARVNPDNTMPIYSHKVQGGAIYSTNKNFAIIGNGTVNFSNNSVYLGKPGTENDVIDVAGGAIYAQNGLNIQGNDTVTFSGNYERTEDGYLMRALYGRSDNDFYFSANDGGKIEFRDTFTLAKLNKNPNLHLNAEYDGNAQTGEIILSGADAEKNLQAIKSAAGAGEATAEEIAASRHFSVAGTVTLYAGTLSLDMAKLEAGSFVLKSGSTLKLNVIDSQQASLTLSGSCDFENNSNVVILLTETNVGELTAESNTVNILVADVAASTAASDISAVGDLGTLWEYDSDGFEWKIEDGKTWITGTVNAVTSIVADSDDEVSVDISDVDDTTSRTLTVTSDATISGDNTHSGGTIISDANVTLGSATALGNGVVTTSGTSSITTEDGVTAVLKQAISNTEGTLTLNGSYDVTALETQDVDPTWLNSDLEPGKNGFYQDKGSSVQVVENGEDGVLSPDSDATIKHGNREYILNTDTGMAIAPGEIDWSVYYMNTSDHEAKVSEIIEASKDAQGDALLQQIQMSAGTLGVNQSVYLMAAPAINENGEIAARPVINVSGDDTELSGMIDCATMHASGGKISATLHGDTSLTVTGDVEISGESSQTGDTIITGPDAKLTIGTDTALGASTVKLQNQATLDLNHKAANNMIEVTGCTVANADKYVGRMEVASHMTFVGPASAGCISLRDKGAITAESLRTTTLEALSDKGAERYSEHTIIGNVTINDSGAIILYSGKQITLTRGSLTLGNGVAMVLLDAGGEFAVGDILVTCISGTITGDFSELDFLINNEEQEGYRVEISEDRKSVVLAEEDKPIDDPDEEEEDKPIVDPGEEEEDKPIVGPEEDEEDKPIVGPDVPVQPEPAPVFDQATADVLSQGNWGIVSASRAFVGAVQGQRNNMGCIANGRGTAWASLLGGMTDISGSGTAAGSDITLFGAAVGVDMKVGKSSSLGVAFGYTDGEVSADGLGDIDQEGGHIALYGEHGLKKFANNSCLSLDWVAATGTTESKYMGAKWEQNSIQLNTRLTWNKQVTDRFSYNVFGGLEYFASESDRVQNCKSGSIQNLRGELGMGVRYVALSGTKAVEDEKSAEITPACERVVLYGEVSYINDMVRNNPSIEVNGLRGSGANPGRQGVGVEAGATIRLGEQWSASANYSFNAMDDSNEHVLNIGASRTF